jgi:hypothetical protein
VSESKRSEKRGEVVAGRVESDGLAWQSHRGVSRMSDAIGESDEREKSRWGLTGVKPRTNSE